MVIYSQNDVRAKLDNKDFYCNSLSLRYDAQLEPSFDIKAKNSFSNVVAGAARGSINISYYVTGSDPLVDKMENERASMPFYFNGLYINSGYLNNYSFSAEYGSNVEVSATINFYEKIKGSFSPQEFDLPEVDPLNISDMTLDNGSALISEDKIKSFNFSYSSTLAPSYKINDGVSTSDEKVAYRVTSQNDKKVDITFSLYDHDLALPITGQRESFKINLKNKNGISKQTYAANGFIRNKSIGAKAGEDVISDYSFGQANLGGGDPSISSISPIDGGVSEQVTINGTNFSTLDKVLLGEFKCDIVSSSDTSIVVKTNPDIISGYKAPMRVITQGGEAIGTTTYSVTGGLTYF